jgi:hypothetical protein
VKSSKALKRARRQIETDKNSYICNALFSIGAINTAVYKALKGIFKEKSVDFWLLTESKDFKDFISKSTHDTCREQLRLYRLRWIDWMIEGYEKAGD